ncbi:MAG: hypothetical protein LBT27_05285 [Prevotellaceae bacterium]|jgi:hypothetical protein|nr:hypothetical protein [Prevotellaceae bacterium]
MKKILITITLCFLSISILTGQENIEKKYTSKIGITFSALGHDNIYYLSELKADFVSFNANDFYTLGINYTLGLNKYKWVEIETGIEYSKHNITATTYLNENGTLIANKNSKENFTVLNIPVTARINFLDYFFINGGFVFDAIVSSDSPIHKKTGIGAIVGIAAKYDFNFNVSVFCNPYIKYHYSVLSFSEKPNNEKITEKGIRFGVMYKL